MSNVKVIIERGIPGSGKSTHAKANASSPEYICSADDHFINKEGVYEFKAHELPQAHAKCLKKFIGLVHQHSGPDLVGGRNTVIVVDNTNLRRAEFEAYVKVAEIGDCDVEFSEFVPPRDETLGDYVRLCASRNAHGVSPNQCMRMASVFERLDE